MNALLERIARRLRPQQPARPTSAAGLEDASAARLGLSTEGWPAGDRLQVYRDVERLDEQCPEASAALDAVASLVSAPLEGEESPFRVEWEPGAPEGAREAVGRVVARARLGAKTYSIARDAAKYGDNFLEIVLDEALEVVRLKHLPARQLFREEGPHGELLDPAFTQRQFAGGAPLVAFHAWQIVHIRWGHLGEQRYGRSHLAAARVVWQRLRPLEESMRIARLERGYDKLVHYVEIPPDCSFEEAQRRLEDYRRHTSTRVTYNPETAAYELRRTAPSVRTDFYVPVSRTEGGQPTGGDIKLLAADNAQLARIADVEYAHRQLLCALRVPPAFLGFEHEVNARATLGQQYAEFARTICRAQATLSAAYRQVFDLQLLLKGYEPERLGYRLVWADPRVEDELARAQADLLRARAAALTTRRT